MSKQAILRQKFRQYSQKAILSKMPADFIGVAKQYASVKKQRMMSQQLFDSRKHELSSIQKINQSLQKSLKRKKKQLRYVQAVRNRYIEQNIKKQRLAQIRKIELSQLRNQTTQQRYESEIRLSQARQKFFRKKKNQYQQSRKQINNYKSQKLLEQSALYSRNQSRVKQIQQQKSRIRQYYDKFFQNKNRKYMQSYKQSIRNQKRRQQNMKEQMKAMESKLLLIKQDVNIKKKSLQKLQSSIQSLRQSRVSIRESKTRPHSRSMTPFQILSGISTTQNPEKKVKFILKQ